MLLTRSSPGHYIINTFHSAVKTIRLKHPGITIQIKWIPAHQGVEGNEAADALTKKAITHNSSHHSWLPKLLTKTLPYSKLAAKQAFHKKIKSEAQLMWLNSPQYKNGRHGSYDSP